MKMPFRTFTGRIHDLAHPNPKELDLEDVAHGLAHVCRFGGHVNHFYSVAQHSLFVWRLLQTTYPQMKREALLHDASEAYLGDLSHNLKHSPYLTGYRILEAEWMDALSVAFLPPAYNEGAHRPWIKTADNVAAIVERCVLQLGRNWSEHEFAQAVAEHYVSSTVEDLRSLAPTPHAMADFYELLKLTPLLVKGFFLRTWYEERS